MAIKLGATGITFHDNTVQTTAASAGGMIQTQLFTAPGTWTNPGTVTRVRVTVVGGGGGGSTSDGPAPSGPGGVGGVAIAEFTIPTSPVSITVGAGGSGAGPAPGAGGGSGSASSFGPYISATGGGGAPTGQPSPAGPSGTGSISAPVIPGALRSTNIDTLSGGLGFAYGSTVRGSPASAPGTSAIAFAYNNPASAGAGGGSVAQPFSPTTRFSAGGVNGVVIVEFVG
jgi:hypothetical protein